MYCVADEMEMFVRREEGQADVGEVRHYKQDCDGDWVSAA